MKPRITLIVTDLDNTLYDWVTSFAASFYGMVDVAARILEVDRELLLDELKVVHQRYGNSEEPFALLETEIVQRSMATLTRMERAERLDEAFHAFNSARKRTLQPYPGVVETLGWLAKSGVAVVAHTEARVTNAQFRLAKLGMAKFLRRLYALEHPGLQPNASRRDSDDGVPDVRLLREGQRKPDPRILLEICGDMGTSPERTLYVGDSISRDIGMAKEAGTWTAWAEYGTHVDPACWEKLVRVTHWTAEEVRHSEEARARLGDVKPHVVLRSFDELPSFFEFSSADEVRRTGGSSA